MVASQIGETCRNIGFFTLIGDGNHQDLVDRAFSANREGQWISVEPFPGAFVCNVGHIMEFWTNGLYPST